MAVPGRHGEQRAGVASTPRASSRGEPCWLSHGTGRRSSMPLSARGASRQAAAGQAAMASPPALRSICSGVDRGKRGGGEVDGGNTDREWVDMVARSSSKRLTLASRSCPVLADLLATTSFFAWDVFPKAKTAVSLSVLGFADLVPGPFHLKNSTAPIFPHRELHEDAISV